MTKLLRHTGPYRDTPSAAITAALDEVKIDTGDYIQAEYADAYQLLPVDPDAAWQIDIDLFYSTTREQWKAKLVRVPHRHHAL